MPIGISTPPTSKGEPEDTREALQQAKRTLGPDKGYSHYATVPDEQLTDAFHYTLFPILPCRYGLTAFTFYARDRIPPTPSSACLIIGGTRAQRAWQPNSMMAPAPPSHSRVTDQVMCPLSGLPAAKDSIGPAIEDDVAVFITQQRGVRSRGFKGAYLSGQEKRISRYHERIDDYIDGTL